MARTGFSKPLVEHLMSFQHLSFIIDDAHRDKGLGRGLHVFLSGTENALIEILHSLSSRPKWLAPLKTPWRVLIAPQLGDSAWLGALMESLNRALQQTGAWDIIKVPHSKGCILQNFDSDLLPENSRFGNEPRSLRLCQLIGESYACKMSSCAWHEDTYGRT